MRGLLLNVFIFVVRSIAFNTFVAFIFTFDLDVIFFLVFLFYSSGSALSFIYLANKTRYTKEILQSYASERMQHNSLKALTTLGRISPFRPTSRRGDFRGFLGLNFFSTTRDLFYPSAYALVYLVSLFCALSQLLVLSSFRSASLKDRLVIITFISDSLGSSIYRIITSYYMILIIF